MEIVVLVVVVLGSLASAQDNETRLGEVLFPRHQKHLQELFMSEMNAYVNVGNISDLKQVTRINEIINYTNTFRSAVVLEFIWDLGNVTIQSFYETINSSCSINIDEISAELKDAVCVSSFLWEMVTSKFQHAVEDVLEKMSRDCDQAWPTLCSTERRHCTTAYEGSVRSLLRGYYPNNHVELFASSTKPLQLIAKVVIMIAKSWNSCFVSTHFFPWLVVSIPPFTFENVIHYWKVIHFSNKITYSEERSWGIITSRTQAIREISHKYYTASMIESYFDLISCTFKDPTARPLTWRTVSSLYFNSPCLCVLYKGNNCKVKAPRGVYTVSYCFSVLLRDFQRQITYRPAVTYLDYAFQTRIPICNFTNLLLSKSWLMCNNNGINKAYDLIASVKCYFKDVVSNDINCSKTVALDTYDNTVLCDLINFVPLVHCEDDIRMKFIVTYYKAGNSILVVSLTFLDVASRVLTLLSYLACPQLRNLPGKLMMCYLTTALMRLLVVHALLDDMEWAVRLDVTMDLACALWLTAYLHFLTTSIRTLRLPDSLSRAEARQVLIRYSLFGWVLPVALSSTFLWLDQILDSGIQFGQLMFVFFNYAALFANLYMFFYNCRFYYDVTSSVSGLGLRGKPRNIFANLINFALKTSVLSGAGITIRLALTQIQGLEVVLGYYHMVGTFQWLLLFMLYGCNREARVFWLSLFRRIIGRCKCRKNNSLRRNSMELTEISPTESLQNCSSL